MGIVDEVLTGTALGVILLGIISGLILDQFKKWRERDD